ncbi:MAG: hypothetical protein ACK4RK_07395 [Gemmataceae bacterium]
MPIRFSCPYCRQVLCVSRQHAVQTMACPSCHQMITLPAVLEEPRASSAGERIPAPINESPSSVAAAHSLTAFDWRRLDKGLSKLRWHLLADAVVIVSLALLILLLLGLANYPRRGQLAAYILGVYFPLLALAVGGVLAAASLVLWGKIDVGFASQPPPYRRLAQASLVCDGLALFCLLFAVLFYFFQPAQGTDRILGGVGAGLLLLGVVLHLLHLARLTQILDQAELSDEMAFFWVWWLATLAGCGFLVFMLGGAVVTNGAGQAINFAFPHRRPQAIQYFADFSWISIFWGSLGVLLLVHVLFRAASLLGTLRTVITFRTRPRDNNEHNFSY